MRNVISKIKNFAEHFVKWFVLIATGILIICAINFSGEEELPRFLLYHILTATLLTAVVTTVFFMMEPMKKSSMVLCRILHFFTLTAVMIVCGLCFRWIDPEPMEMLWMGGCVACVYAFVMTGYYILDKHRADQINQRLKEMYGDEDF